MLWMHQVDMFCLPLYSFQDKGIQSKPAFMRREYAPVKNYDDHEFLNQGVYPPIEVQNRTKPMSAMTSVSLTGGMRVGCNEDISMVGRVTEKSYRDLVKLWQTLSSEAQSEGWRK